MADLDQLKNALRNAHSAGDTQAARRLARAIQNQTPTQPIQSGDWQELSRRVSSAAAAPIDAGEYGMVLGPPTQEQSRERRQQAARDEGRRYGSARNSNLDAAETFIRNWASTATLGADRHLEAATGGLLSGRGNLNHAERHEFLLGADEGRNEASPYAWALGTGAGIVNQAALLGRALPAAYTAPTTVREAARTSAIIGGGAGAADRAINTRGDVGETVMGGMFGAGAGGAAGAAVQAATPFVAGAWRAVSDRVRNLARSPRESAAVQVRRSLEGITPDDLRRVARNPDAALIDAGGTAARDNFRAATNVSPRAHERASNFMLDRAGREADSLTQSIQSATGQSSAAQRQAAIRQGTSRTTSDLYNQAFREAPDHIWNENLAGFMQSRVGQQALRNAMETVDNATAAARLAGDSAVPSPMPLVADDLGNLSVRPDARLGLEFWNEVYKATGRIAQAARQSTDPAARQRAAELTSIRKALAQQLDGYSSTFSRARGAAADAFGAEDAVDFGRLAMSPSRDRRDVMQVVNQMTPEQRLEAARGAGAEAVRLVQASARDPAEGGTRSVASSVFTPERTARLRALAPDNEAGTQLMRDIDMWKRFAESRRALGNSTTARQLATQAALFGAPVGASAAYNQGMPSPTAVALGSALAGGNAFARSRASKIGDEMVNMYLSRGPIPRPTPVVPQIPPQQMQALQRALTAGVAVQAGQAGASQ